MDKEQAIRRVKETLEASFKRDVFLNFTKNLLNKIEETPDTIYRGNYIPDVYKDYINTMYRIGKYEDPDGQKIDVLAVELKKETSLDRARTMQRNFVAWFLNGSRGGILKDAALVAFVSPNEEDWRFSFVKMEYAFKETVKGNIKVKSEFTPVKRYSFLVGQNENSHTAQSRLVPLLQRDEQKPKLAEIEELFSVEKATKEFFEKYRDLYFRTHAELEKLVAKDKSLRDDFQEKNVSTVDFCKKLLGQIVFLYFLQRKGWFGVKRDEKWGAGSKRFLRELFEGKHGKYKNYFNDILEPLFYDALARDRSDIDHWNDQFKCKIPFLNGGLFDPINDYDWTKTEIHFPNELFSNNTVTKEGDKGDGILDVFDRFNFTVKEDEPLEKEVAVDPEMLGKVFENLLEVKDRKSKGTYYTPREIVHYMCVQSLINYLATELEGKVSKEDLEKLIKHGESVGENEARVERVGEETSRYYYKLPESIREHARQIDEKLADIKVCDPAIGSGAFPVGMMTEIVRARTTLSSYLSGRDRTTYNFKRHCIHNSLYGVDIDPGAIEIAKLRLWLSLIVDEEDIKQIKPLPNLDYKIMQGNSLLEEYEGIKLFDDKFIAKESFDKESQLNDLKAQQSKLQNEYIKLHNDDKLSKVKQGELKAELERLAGQIKKLSKPEIKQANTGLFEMISEAKRKADKLKALHEAFFDTIHKKEKDALKKEIENLEWELIEATLREQGKTSDLKKLEEFKRSNTKPFFLWKLNFSEVFQNKGGFDVVIANPPYGIVYDDKIKQYYENKYSCFLRNNDIYVAFYQKGVGLLSVAGHLTYISPNTFLNGDYFKGLRSYMTSNIIVDEITDYKNIHVFQDPTVFVCVFIASKCNKIDSSYDAAIHVATNDIKNMKSYPIRVDYNSYQSFKPSNPIMINIMSNSNMKTIDEVFYVKDVGFNYWTKGKGKKRDGDSIGDRVFYSGERRSKDDIPFLKGRDIYKWRYKYPSNWLKSDYKKYLKQNDTFRFTASFLCYVPKIIYRQTSSKIIAAIDYDGHYLDKTVHLIVPRNSWNEYKPEMLLAILNSRLGQYLYSHISQESEGRAFAQVKTTYIKQIPIPCSVSNRRIENEISQIIALVKKDNPLSEEEYQKQILAHEAVIDKLIYEMYGLSDVDVESIENSTVLTDK